MSYARWGDDSDVYIFSDVDGGITCCNCWLLPGQRQLADITAAIAHLEEHRRLGDAVPDRAFEQLYREMPARTAGP